MCGIIGYIGKKDNCLKKIISGLEHLEYRGYDSAGICYLNNSKLKIIKEVGKIKNLKKKLNLEEKSNLVIGHTRWATHGASTINNSHPHSIGKITIVHNGIIENYDELKKQLIKKGYKFISDTDTEVACALLDSIYKKKKDMLKTLEKANNILKGSYAMGIITSDKKQELYALKKNSPLIIGIGQNENYIASDMFAILDNTNKYIVLEDNNYARITNNSIKIYKNGKEERNKILTFQFDKNEISKKDYEHYMLKEIEEQPEVYKKLIDIYFKEGAKTLLNVMPNFEDYKKIVMVACGSAAHASMIGKYMLSKYADIKAAPEIASEFRYNKLFLDKKDLVIAVSQSGETIDTLEALKIANSNNNDTLGIVNVKGSSIARISKKVLYTEAGNEIAVATTKAYFAQSMILSLIALSIGIRKNIIDKKTINLLEKESRLIPKYLQNLIENKKEYQKIANYLKDKKDIFFIGRGIDYALSMEGSLKLKEISYIHSEAYQSGELKHGSISLIEKGTPVIAIVTDDNIATKTINNIKEVKARGAKVIYITNREKEEDDTFYDERIIIPKVSSIFTPLLAIIPLQLIAYYVAKEKGCDIDKPKNLAKSVTVE